jgi:hypothetical protein
MPEDRGRRDRAEVGEAQSAVGPVAHLDHAEKVHWPNRVPEIEGHHVLVQVAPVAGLPARFGQDGQDRGLDHATLARSLQELHKEQLPNRTNEVLAGGESARDALPQGRRIRDGTLTDLRKRHATTACAGEAGLLRELPQCCDLWHVRFASRLLVPVPPSELANQLSNDPGRKVACLGQRWVRGGDLQEAKERQEVVADPSGGVGHPADPFPDVPHEGLPERTARALRPGLLTLSQTAVRGVRSSSEWSGVVKNRRMTSAWAFFQPLLPGENLPSERARSRAADAMSNTVDSVIPK